MPPVHEMDIPDSASHSNQFSPAIVRSPPHSHIIPPRDGLDFELLDGQDTGRSKGPVAVTSRVSVQRFCSVVSQFGEFKRAVANQTGFGGMMGMHAMPKINLKYSDWVMIRVDPVRRVLKLDQDHALQFGAKDPNKLFGLPCVGNPISPVCAELSDACLEYTQIALELSERRTHSLKAAETILLEEINETSSQLDIDCFKIAFVIFTVGHLLCPSTKHDYTSVDYWGALNDPSTLAEFNWCEYVLQHLMDAVRKLKADMITRHSAIHLVGCHLFLQLLLLDNMDLGPLTIVDQLSPRVSLFEYDTVRKMIDVMTTSSEGEQTFFVPRGLRGDDVGYTKSIVCESRRVQDPPVMQPPPEIPIPPHSLSVRPPPSSAGNMVRRNQNKSTAIDFDPHLSRTYPELNKLRQQWQDEMFNYSEKLLKIISERYRSCKCSTEDMPKTPFGRHNIELQDPRAQNLFNITPINLSTNNTECSGSSTGHGST